MLARSREVDGCQQYACGHYLLMSHEYIYMECVESWINKCCYGLL